MRAGAEAIGTKEDELGTLVSVDLSVAEVGPTTTATLLVPSANLPEAGEAPLAPWPS
ncbi:MAG: hypothetical protein ABIS47_11775 [Acidimicrobiales bacterium]